MAAARHLVDGAIGRWLEETASRVHEYDHSDAAEAREADEYEAAAISAQLVLEKLSTLDNDSVLDRQLALEEWLWTFPFYHSQPQLSVSPLERDIVKCCGSARHQRQISKEWA